MTKLAGLAKWSSVCLRTKWLRFRIRLLLLLINFSESKDSFFGFNILVFMSLILLCGDIKEYPGLKIKPNDNLSVCKWNVNGILSHNFQKMAVLESFVAMHRFDIICISETFLNNTYEDSDLNVNGYSLLRADHPSNAKRGRICIYYKKTLALKMILSRIQIKTFFVKLQLDKKSVL